MYSTCLFCHNALGTNEVIEHFPVGRRLAFDAGRGRLWAICQRCRRWNLSPVEERWEAIDACERTFRATATRVSTENIGLARVAEGLELVRIGRPERGEFAAWRYGEQLGKRRRSTLLKIGLGLGAVGAVAAGGAVVGVGIGGFAYWLYQWADGIVRGSPNTLVARIETADGTVPVRRRHLEKIQLISENGDAWSLSLPHRRRIVRLGGEEGIRAAGLVLPHINRFGGTRQQVNEAVSLLGEDPDPLRYFRRTIGSGRKERAVVSLPPSHRLALEMAAHEETERRAMEGELAELERAWKAAEEIAGIADDMFLPTWVTDRIDRWR
jgi:hypothetical protein